MERIENTYAWIIETEISKINNKSWVKIKIERVRMLLVDCPDEPRRERSRCPAIMFAVRRIARVNGRMISLIDSIITMNGIRRGGVPIGVKWEKKSFR